MGDAPRVELAGSERTPLPEERRVSPADPGQRVEVTVQLRRRGALPDPGKARPHLRRREIEEIAGADPEDIARDGIEVTDERDRIRRHPILYFSMGVALSTELPRPDEQGLLELAVEKGRTAKFRPHNSIVIGPQPN